MKIILKHGNRMYIVKCPECNCEFLYEYGDTSAILTQEGFYRNKVQCPECGNWINADKQIYNETAKNKEQTI